MKVKNLVHRAACIAALLLAFSTNSARAATFIVTNTADTNDGVCNVHCSLREAITAANNAAGDDIIRFADNVRGAIDLNNTLPFLSTNIDIQGPGANLLTVRRNTASGTPDFRLLNIWGVVSLSGLTFSNGRITDARGEAGAINMQEPGVLTIRNCVFSHNYGMNGGAIYNQRATVLIYNTTFTDNTAGYAGAAIFNNASSLPDNSMLISQCTFSNNTAIQYVGGAIHNAMPLTIEHSTFLGNEAPHAAGIYNLWTVSIHDTLLANTGSNIENGSGASALITSQGYNLANDNGGGFLTGPGDLLNTDPLLLPLADNGGPTPTHALRFGSPAINAGNPNFTAPPDFDQRGLGFPRVIYGRIDIGAFENQPQPNVNINDVSVTEGNSGTANATFTVTLLAHSAQTISVSPIVYNGTAKAPADYTSGGARLIFAPGETSKTFSVPVIGDLLNEPNETFYVILSSPVNCSIGKGRGIGTIIDDDAPPIITIDDVRIGEGNSGQRTAAFRLKLSSPSGQVVKVNYATASGTATPGSDYVQVASTQVAFTTGNLYAYARVLVNGDTLNEASETFYVNLSGAQNATIARTQAQGTILNDDSPPALSINDVSVSEGNSGTKTLNFIVTLSNASGQNITVHFATADGIARLSSDYVAQSGDLTFTPGQTTKTISVVINGDTTIEGDETLYLLLSGATNASIGRGRGVGTILDDDASG